MNKFKRHEKESPVRHINHVERVQKETRANEKKSKSEKHDGGGKSPEHVTSKHVTHKSKTDYPSKLDREESSAFKKRIKAVKRNEFTRRDTAPVVYHGSKPPYVGRIGDCDLFIKRLRSGELNLKDFHDPDYRRDFELRSNFKIQPVPPNAFAVDLPNYMRTMNKKIYLKAQPRFNFIGRYDFENKHLFVMVWKTVFKLARDNGPDGKIRYTKIILEEDDRYARPDSSFSTDQAKPPDYKSLF